MVTVLVADLCLPLKKKLRKVLNFSLIVKLALLKLYNHLLTQNA